MSISVLKRRVNVLREKRLSDSKIMSFLDLKGGKFMEQIDNNRFEMFKVEGSFVRNILVGVSERSKIFYNKYLRSTVSYNYLEVKRIREKNIENVLWDTIRNQ